MKRRMVLKRRMAARVKKNLARIRWLVAARARMQEAFRKKWLSSEPIQPFKWRED